MYSGATWEPTDGDCILDLHGRDQRCIYNVGHTWGAQNQRMTHSGGTWLANRGHANLEITWEGAEVIVDLEVPMPTGTEVMYSGGTSQGTEVMPSLKRGPWEGILLFFNSGGTFWREHR